jgi:hypothetical protein
MSIKPNTPLALVPPPPAVEEHIAEKDSSFKYHLNKFEYDLFHDEDHKAGSMLRVKHIFLDGEEKWKITKDGKLIFTVDGQKLNQKEKRFLHGVEGVKFLLAQGKAGIVNLTSLRKELKKALCQAS